MGTAGSVIRPIKKEIRRAIKEQQYETCTYFKYEEILELWKKFRNLGAEKITDRIDTKKIEKLKCLKHNPFNARIIGIFCKEEHLMDFDEFVDMTSAFDPRASTEVKSRVCFYLFDCDGRGKLCVNDIKKIVSTMVDPKRIGEIKMLEIARKLFDEADVNNDAELSRFEFQRLCARVPDFQQ